MNYHNEGLLNYDLAHQTLEHLTVARTVYYLTYIFDCGTHEIHIAKEATTPVDLANTITPGCLASRVKIWFWGGPPDGEEWFQGSLLTMLIDKLFYCVALGFEDVVNKFLRTLNGKT